MGDVACWVGEVDGHVYRVGRWDGGCLKRGRRGPTFRANDEILDLGWMC